MKYRFGTHYKIGYGRCFCIQKINFIGNYITIYETNSEAEWNKECIKFLNQ